MDHIRRPYTTMKATTILLFLSALWGTALVAQTQIGTDINGQNARDQFGGAVSISADGTKMVVGAPGSNSPVGYVQVLEYKNDQWQQMGNTISGNNSTESFGLTVAIAADGNRVAIGAPFNGVSNNSGLVRIYEYNGSQWQQLGSDIVGAEGIF